MTALPQNTADASFPKQEKLKSRKQIAALFEQGKSVSHYPLKLVYLPTTTKSVTQAGVTVPKRRFKLAVTRNRIKRLMREGYRHRKSLFFNNNTTAYAFLFLYIGKEIPTQQAVHKALEKVAEKFQKKTSDEPK
jgi:ribonuclease P protein component